MGSVYTEYGTRVHEALEKVATEGAEHTEETRPFAQILGKILNKPGEHRYEYKMAVTSEKIPCEWFAPEVWLRSIADVLIINGEKAILLDYKSGKVKEDPTQLIIFVAMVFIHFPEVESVKAGYIWLLKGEVTSLTYTRNMLPHIWLGISPRLEQLQDAVDMGVFVAKPSPLCSWCPAKDICPDAQQKRRR